MSIKCTPKTYEVYLKKEMAVNIMTCMFQVMHYCLQVYLKTLEICVLIYMELILYILSCIERSKIRIINRL